MLFVQRLKKSLRHNRKKRLNGTGSKAQAQIKFKCFYKNFAIVDVFSTAIEFPDAG